MKNKSEKEDTSKFRVPVLPPPDAADTTREEAGDPDENELLGIGEAPPVDEE